jgi:hypothetical protein
VRKLRAQRWLDVPLVVLFSVKVLRKLRLSEDKGLLSWGAGDPPLKLDWDAGFGDSEDDMAARS